MTEHDTHTPRAQRRAQPLKQGAIRALREAAHRPETLDAAVVDRMHSADALRKSRRSLAVRRSRLPELAPADAPRQDTKSFGGLDMTSTAVVNEETRFSKREESRNETAKLTVYVMNAILLVIAFPVGFGMLVFNILGGENLRTTAHVIALTGFAIALTGGAFGSDFLYGVS